VDTQDQLLNQAYQLIVGSLVLKLYHHIQHHNM